VSTVPYLNLAAPEGECPFVHPGQAPRHRANLALQAAPSAKARAGGSTAKAGKEKRDASRNDAGNKRAKPGTCFLCKSKFKSFVTHVASAEHLKRAREDAGNAELDGIAALLPVPPCAEHLDLRPVAVTRCDAALARNEKELREVDERIQQIDEAKVMCNQELIDLQLPTANTLHSAGKMQENVERTAQLNTESNLLREKQVELQTLQERLVAECEHASRKSNATEGGPQLQPCAR
ncbi:hypothetical protein CYMTET_33267, partial [Cymbomonas tetramitiformis]